MSDDFVTRLQLQLREAAERETRRGPIGRASRAAAAARWRVTGRQVLVGVALACSLAIVAAALTALYRTSPPVEQPVVSPPRLEIVAGGPLVRQGGAIAAGRGAVWVSDADTGELLRVDPRNQRVLARVPLGAQAIPTAGAGAVWATANGRLIRIDPATNRVVARIPLGLGARTLARVSAERGVVWVGYPLELLRIDPRRNAIDRRIPLDHQGYQANGFASDQSHLYVQRADGVLLVLNPATGARESSTRLAINGFLVGAADGTVTVANGSDVAAMDARDGRTLWRMNLGDIQVNDGFVAGPSVWIHVTDRTTDRDRLVRLDAHDGHRTGSVTLPEFGVAGFAPVGRDVWIVTPNGRLVIAR